MGLSNKKLGFVAPICFSGNHSEVLLQHIFEMGGDVLPTRNVHIFHLSLSGPASEVRQGDVLIAVDDVARRSVFFWQLQNGS